MSIAIRGKPPVTGAESATLADLQKRFDLTGVSSDSLQHVNGAEHSLMRARNASDASWFAGKATKVAGAFGSPKFFAAQGAIVGAWVGANALGITEFDPYPFIFLNLVLSGLSAFSATIVMNAARQQEAITRAETQLETARRDVIAEAAAHKQDGMAKQLEALTARSAGDTPPRLQGMQSAAMSLDQGAASTATKAAKVVAQIVR